MARWLSTLQVSDGRFVVVTHAAVIRAAVVAALDASPRTFWNVDAEPLCFVRLQAHAGRWKLRFAENIRD